MKITVCGDIHSDFETFDKILMNAKSHVIQVGDLGVGYHNHNKHDPISQFHCDYGWSFIHGNHDDPRLCQQYSNYLGRHHYDSYLDILYVSGGFTPPKAQKDSGHPPDRWVQNEQLSVIEFNEILKLIKKFRPETIITHSAPMFVSKGLGFDEATRTKIYLGKIFNSWQPKNWIFGHFHRDISKTIVNKYTNKSTKFTCLPKCGVMEIEV